MIPAPPGIVARYKQRDPRNDGTHLEYMTTEEVIAFDEDNRPLVRGKRGLVLAESYSNFVDIAESAHPRIVAVLPAGGWRVRYVADDATWSEPLVGWGLRTDGSVVPLDSDCDGLVEALDEVRSDFQIYHPEADPVSATESQDLAPADHPTTDGGSK